MYQLMLSQVLSTIFAIAVAQLPPPIIAILQSSFMLCVFLLVKLQKLLV
jgi:hypothetical protein